MVKRNAILQPLLLGAVLALGFGIVWGLIAAWCVTVAEQAARAGKVYRNIQVLLDGTPVIQSYSYSYGYYLRMTYETLDGQPITLGDDSRSLHGTSLRRPPGKHGRWMGLNWRQRLVTFQDDSGQVPVYWYLIHNGELDGAAYFVGYHGESRLRLGYIGRKGFRRDEPPADELFPIDGRRMPAYDISGVISGQNYYWRRYYYQLRYDAAGRIPGWMVYLISDDRLMEIDLHGRSVRTLLESPGLLAVGAVEPALPSAGGQDPKIARDWLAVRTEDRILILDSDGKQHRSYTIPARLRKEDFTLYELGDATVMALVTRQFRRDGRTRYAFSWFNSQGGDLRQKTVDVESGSWSSRPGVAACILGAAIPAPALYTPFVLVALPREYRGSGEFPDYPSALSQAFSDTWPMLLVVNLLGVALAWVCARRQRRHAQPWSGVWVGFVFLFGVPGLVGYLFCRGWPVRKACPACNRPVPRDRQRCSACHEEFPEPAPEGIEVLV